MDTSPMPPAASAAPTSRSRRAVLIGALIALGAALSLFTVRPAPPPEGPPVALPIDAAKAPRLGRAEAPVRIVVFEDFKCPFCRDFHLRTLPRLEEAFVRSGRANVTFVHYPFIAPDSRRAALAAACVHRARPELFWPYASALYAAQGPEWAEWATRPRLLEIGERVPGVDVAALARCLDAEDTRADVEADLALGRRAGVPGTPSVFVNGRLQRDVGWNALRARIAAP